MATNYNRTVQAAETERLQRLLERQLTAAKETSDRINRITEQMKAVPASPPFTQTKFSMTVQFTEYGKVYEYLLLRVGPRWFTTGTGDSAQFSTWGDFVRWVRENVYSHGPLLSLAPDSNYAHIQDDGLLQ